MTVHQLPPPDLDVDPENTDDGTTIVGVVSDKATFDFLVHPATYYFRHFTFVARRVLNTAFAHAV